MKPTTKITFDGLNLEKLLNTLQKEQICVLKAKKLSKITCEIVIYTAFCQKVVALLNKKCYNNIYVCNMGSVAFLQKCKQHVALLVAICLIFPMLAISSAFCWKINVDGYDRQQVLDVLGDLSVKQGCLLSKLDVSALENQLSSKLGVSYALVERCGSTLNVKIVQTQTANPPVNLNTPADIVASHSGVITRLVVLQGNAVVKVGDRVSKGQLLIEGKRVFLDGTYQPVTALGQVWATVESTCTVDFVASKLVLRPTEKVFYRTVVKLGNYVSAKPIPFDYFTVTNSQSVNLCGVIVEKQTVVQLQYETVTQQFDDCVEQLKNQALLQATQQADFTADSVIYKVSGNTVTATIYGTKNVAKSTNGG